MPLDLVSLTLPASLGRVLSLFGVRSNCCHPRERVFEYLHSFKGSPIDRGEAFAHLRESEHENATEDEILQKILQLVALGPAPNDLW